MAIVNKSNLDLIYKELAELFALQTAPAMWLDRVATLHSTDKQIVELSQLVTLSKPRKWVGEKTLNSLAGQKYTVTCDRWEETVAAHKHDVDASGMLLAKVPEMAKKLQMHKQVQLCQLIEDLGDQVGKTTCIDGAAFFASSHDRSGNTGAFGNLETSKALSATNFATVWTNMASRSDGVMPLGISPDTLMVPAALAITAKSLMGDAILSSSSNSLVGMASVVVAKELASTTTWYLLDTMSGKPFIFVEKMAPALVEPDYLPLTGDFVFSAEAVGAPGFGDPALATKVTA